MVDNLMDRINQDEIFELMQKIIEIEKKYLYDKHYVGAFDMDRIKNIAELIDTEVGKHAD